MSIQVTGSAQPVVKRKMTCAVLTLVLALAFFFMGGLLGSLAPAPVVPFRYGAQALSLSAVTLTVLLFLSPRLFRAGIWTVMGLFLLFSAVLSYVAWEEIAMYQKEIAELLKHPLSSIGVPRDESFVSTGWQFSLWCGICAFAILCFLIWLQRK